MKTRTIGCNTSLVWIKPGDDGFILMELQSDGHEYNFRWSKEDVTKLFETLEVLKMVDVKESV